MEQMMGTMPNMIYPKPSTPAPVAPKKKHTWIIILIVLVILALVIAFFISQRSSPMTDQQKIDLLQQFNESNTTVITEEQKFNIVNDLSTGSSGQNLSEQEKQRILESLN